MAGQSIHPFEEDAAQHAVPKASVLQGSGSGPGPQGLVPWWTGETCDQEAAKWRESHKVALLALEQEWGAIGHIYIEDLARLVQSLVSKKPAGPKASPADQRTVFQNLGRLTAQHWPMEGGYLEETPLGYVLADVFRTWAACGCQGGVITPSASGVVRWVTNPKAGECTYRHWSETLINAACGETGYYLSLVDRQQPWRTLRREVDAFLEGWAMSAAAPTGNGDTIAMGPTRLQQGPIGLCCLALRSIVTLNPRRLSQTTAERLARLEEWMGPTAATKRRLPRGEVAQQQVAWDRYLLERTGRLVRGGTKNGPARIRKL